MGFLLGMATESVGHIQRARAQEDQSKAQAQALEFNAAAAEQDANLLDLQAEANISADRRAQRKTRGAQRASFAASGLTVENSAIDVLESSAIEQELDNLITRNQADLEIRNLRNKASFDRASAANFRQAGRVNRRTGNINAATGIITGGTRIAKMLAGGA